MCAGVCVCVCAGVCVWVCVCGTSMFVWVFSGDIRVVFAYNYCYCSSLSTKSTSGSCHQTLSGISHSIVDV